VSAAAPRSLHGRPAWPKLEALLPLELRGCPASLLHLDLTDSGPSVTITAVMATVLTLIVEDHILAWAALTSLVAQSSVAALNLAPVVLTSMAALTSMDPSLAFLTTTINMVKRLEPSTPTVDLTHIPSLIKDLITIPTLGLDLAAP
jgi:hypothetical protein